MSKNFFSFGSEREQETVLSKSSKPEVVSHALVMAAATIVVLAGIHTASGIVAPILLALFATIILLVPLRWLRSIGVPSITSLIIVLGCAAILFVVMARVVISSVAEIGQKIPTYTTKISENAKQIEDMLKDYGFSVQFIRERISLQNHEETPEDETENTTENENVTDSPKTTSDNSSSNENAEKNVQKKETINKEKSSKETNLSSAKDSNSKKSSDSVVADLPKQTEKTSNFPKTSQNTNDNDKIDKMSDTDSFADLKNDNDNETSEAENEDGDSENDAENEKTAAEVQKYINKLDQESEPSLIDLNPASVGYWLTKAMYEVRRLAETSFLVMIITLFMIFEASRFPEKIDRAFGKGPITNEHLHKIANEIRRYLFLKAVSSMMSASAATIVYFCFGVPSPLFWGLVALFLYFIPNIGGIVAAIIPGLLIFSMDGPVSVMIYAVCLIAIECTIGYGIEPRILGYGLGISTVVIFISLLTWGWILGPIGLFLAAPLTIMVKIILQAFKETEWIAVLIGD